MIVKMVNPKNSQKSESIGLSERTRTFESVVPSECNICGWTKFGKGPGNRLSATGKAPRCERCQSLERHRSVRRLFERIRLPLSLERISCLQFSPDRAVEPIWFASHAVSCFGGSHSLDIQDLPFASQTFDCVICNHVLEHVPDDRSAIVELFRIVSDRGFLQIGVPDPHRRPLTVDWGYPRPEDHEHFRVYGQDIIKKFRDLIQKAYVISLVENDPVTEMEDVYFILTRSIQVCSKLQEIYPDASIEFIDSGVGVPIMDVVTKIPDQIQKTLLPRFHAGETVRDQGALLRYFLDAGHQSISGWIEPGALTTTLVFSAMQRSLGVAGHICEIGIHHGRYAIALSHLRRLGERTVAIDVFEQQELNVDFSGKGDYNIFMSNVETWLGDDDDVTVLKRDSLSLTCEEILIAAKGRVRLFSIDGSHTYGHTLNDLHLAEGVISEGGIVIVDDFFNPAWPGVPDAIATYLRDVDNPRQLAAVGFGDNKFYLAERSKAEVYKQFIRETFRTLTGKFKEVSFGDQEIVYFTSPAPNRILAPPFLEVGQQVNMDESSVGKAMLFTGWHKPESKGTWAKGGISTIVMRCSPSSEGYITIELEVVGILDPVAPSNRITTFLNGRFLATTVFTPEALRQRILLRFDQKEMPVDGRIEIALEVDRGIVPADIGLGSDRRNLGYFLSSMCRLT